MSFPAKWDQVYKVFTYLNFAGRQYGQEWLVKDLRTGQIIAACGSVEKAEEIAERRFEEMKEKVEQILLGD